MLLPAFANRIYQVKSYKNATIANLKLLKDHLLMTCTSHRCIFALANDFFIDYQNSLYFLIS